MAAGKGRDGGETRRGVRGEAGTRTAAGGAGAEGGTGPGARGKSRLREASGSDAAASWAGEGRATVSLSPGTWEGRSFAGRRGSVYHTVRGGRSAGPSLPVTSWGP